MPRCSLLVTEVALKEDGATMASKSPARVPAGNKLILGGALTIGLVLLLSKKSNAAETGPTGGGSAGPGPLGPTGPSGGGGTGATGATGATGGGVPSFSKAPGTFYPVSGGVADPKAGVASDLSTQWGYVVQSGDGAQRIAGKVVGATNATQPTPAIPPGSGAPSTFYKYTGELVDYNLTTNGSIGQRFNENGIKWVETDPPAPRYDQLGNLQLDGVWRVPPYNFRTLMPGSTVLIPKAWNKYIDQMGSPSGSLKGFPSS